MRRARVTGEMQVPVSDGQLPGYFARPQGAGPFPDGDRDRRDLRHPRIHQGHSAAAWPSSVICAVSVELYARLGDLSKMTDAVQQIVRDVISKAPDATVMTDLDATVAWAAANGGDTAKLGITGFCRGGRDVWLYAAHNPHLKAAVAWYGPVNDTTSPIQPKTATDIAAEIDCPLLGLYGAKDPGIKPADVEAAAAKAKAAGKTVDIIVFPDAGHGFNADYRPTYVKDAAEQGWRDMLGWLRKYGVA